MQIDLATGWTERTEGAWRLRYDHRDLLAMRHPWEPSHKGNLASVTREVTIPEDWKGPIILGFYCSDDYQASPKKRGAAGFGGYRLKQVLADDQVVWNVDVSDPLNQGQTPYYKVELPIEPGKTFLLSLLAYDMTGSATEADASEADRFMTHVYWGDLVLAESGVELEAGKRPADKAVRELHTRRWPLPPFGDEWKDPVVLEVSVPGGVPKQGFPIQFGLPLHAAKVKELNDFGLKRSGGKAFGLQKTDIGQWPDGSIQWALVEFPVKPDMKKIELTYGRDKSKAPGTVKIETGETEVAVNAGLIKFKASQGAAITDIQLSGKSQVASLDVSLQVGDEDAVGVTEHVEPTNGGTFRQTVALDGRFDALDKTLGRFTLYVSAYAGLPYLKLVFRLYNNTNESLPVSGLRLKAIMENEPGELRAPSGIVGGELALAQVSEKERTLNGEPVDANEPAYAAWKGGVVAVPKFRELFPKKIAINGKELVVDLIPGDKGPIVFTPGECKTHEVWLALGDVDPAAFAAAADPPILQNAAYYCSTGVLGPAAAYDGVLRERMQAAYAGKTWEDLGQHFGVRDFPDSPYLGGLPKWCNNYYERMLGLWSEWFLSGDRVWYDRAVYMSRHIYDVAVVHSDVPGQDWLGAMHGPGDNHVAAPWAPVMRTEGLDLYYKLTGDEAARDAAVAAADYCVRTKMGIDARSIRDHAGPFDAVCTAYDETGDPAYLDDGTARVESILKSMDMRRGVWPEEHGAPEYRGNVPWMAAQLARPLYLWYRATGDVQAAQALVALAESIICENTDWDAPGHVAGYSHNPQFPPTAQYDPMIVPMIYAAYELTEDTFFLEGAQAQWKRWQASQSVPSVLNDHWNTPWLSWYLRKCETENAKRETPTVTNQEQKGEK